MLKGYKKNNNNGYYFYKYKDGDSIESFFLKYKCHGCYNYWLNRKKIIYIKGYYNMGEKYGHWVSSYYFHYYL